MHSVIRSDLAIMVVDNEPIVRLGITVMLREAGLHCRATDGRPGADALMDDGLKPDLLITDQNMPGQSGIELGTDLKERFPALEILLVSGDESVADELPDGWHILAKPFTAIELRDKMEQIFSSPPLALTAS